MFLIDSSDFEKFREALQKLQINDAALFFEPDTSEAIWVWFSLDFWACCTWKSFKSGLSVNMIFDLITTAPSVIYEIVKKNGDIIYVDNPSKLPDTGVIAEFREPIARCHILVPQEYLGNVITLGD